MVMKFYWKVVKLHKIRGDFMLNASFARRLKQPNRSFFLFGPRATGKSTWLKKNLTDALSIDLLRNDTYFTMSSSPQAFRERVLAYHPEKLWVIVDEVQRMPILLNDVHSLIEDYGYRFALSGSSARKLNRGQANLLAGRALVKHFFPLTKAEYGEAIDVDEALAFGCLPMVITDKETRIEQLEAYVGTYLREEIKEEAVTRNVQAFGRFLEMAGLVNAQVVNLSNIARDAGVSRTTVSSYAEILVDTLLGSWLPAWLPKAKVREVAHPKFYFFDCGVVRAVQKRLYDKPSAIERGLLFETLIFNELKAHIAYESIGGELFYWRTPDGAEVDFIWQRGETVVAIEVKSAERWKDDFHSGLNKLRLSGVNINACYGVYRGEDRLKKDFGLVLPWQVFLQALSDGHVLCAHTML